MTDDSLTNPVLRLNLIGGLANRMIEYIFAVSVKAMVPGLQIANVDIPEWEISHGDIEQDEPSLILPDIMRIDVKRLADEIIRRKLRWISYAWYAQHMDNFSLNREMLSALFPPGEGEGFGPNYLVINIRGDEILDARHPGYVLVPISFYEAIVAQTGLLPVFFGQIDSNAYTDEIRRIFPKALFVHSKGATVDFNILRKSSHIIPAISTFSWLAAWLSNAEVYFPVLGLFNPFQEREHFLLPLDDRRYHFFLFPLVFSVPVERVSHTNAIIKGHWKAVSTGYMRQRLEAHGAARASLLDHLYAFDPAFYANIYPDIKQVFGDDKNQSRKHFSRIGFKEGRVGFAFNERKYVLSNIGAACEIGQGDYASAIDHYLLVGRNRGYQAT